MTPHLATHPTRSAPFAAVPVFISPADILDRMTILDLKLDAARTAEQRSAIAEERRLLDFAWRGTFEYGPEREPDWAELYAVNRTLWSLEDQVRSLSHRGDFGSTFVEACRAIFRTNDQRAAIKRRICDRHGSALRDYKFHQWGTED